MVNQLGRLLTAPTAPVPEDPAQQGQVLPLVPEPSYAVLQGSAFPPLVAPDIMPAL